MALGLLLGSFFAGAGAFVLVGVAVGIAQLFVYPQLDVTRLPYVEATVERAGRTYTGRRCSYHLYLDRPPHHLVYDCEMPRVDAIDRAARAPGTLVEAWYEPTPPWPDAVPRLWQLRVDAVTILAHEEVAIAQRARALPGLALYILLLGVGLLLAAIGVGAFLSLARRGDG